MWNSITSQSVHVNTFHCSGSNTNIFPQLRPGSQEKHSGEEEPNQCDAINTLPPFQHNWEQPPEIVIYLGNDNFSKSRDQRGAKSSISLSLHWYSSFLQVQSWSIQGFPGKENLQPCCLTASKLFCGRGKQLKCTTGTKVLSDHNAHCSYKGFSNSEENK